VKTIKSLLAFCALLILSCSVDPSTYKLPYPDKQFVDKSGTISSYNPEVDILFIIDDSGSMSSYQKLLSENADLFIKQFLNAKFIDYHIGVTVNTPWFSNDGGNLKRVGGYRYVDRKTQNGESILTQLMTVGTTGNGTEKFLNVPPLTFSEIKMKAANKGFYRENAHLVIFVLTDTYDQSDVEPEEAYEFILNLKKGNEQKIHYAGALVTILKFNCKGENKKKIPEKLIRMIDLFQSRGHLFNICKSNYGKDLARMAENIVDAVSTVYLDNLPDVRTMEVWYGKQRIPNQKEGGWTYDYSLNAIHLSPEINIQGEAGKKIIIRYEEIYKPE